MAVRCRIYLQLWLYYILSIAQITNKYDDLSAYLSHCTAFQHCTPYWYTTLTHDEPDF